MSYIHLQTLSHLHTLYIVNIVILWGLLGSDLVCYIIILFYL